VQIPSEIQPNNIYKRKRITLGLWLTRIGKIKVLIELSQVKENHQPLSRKTKKQQLQGRAVSGVFYFICPKRRIEILTLHSTNHTLNAFGCLGNFAVYFFML